MTPLPARQLVERLRRAAALEAAPDAELLTAYVHERCDIAFAELLRRHGPMVWGVCGRLLRCRQDAEDAFQATFLVLVRRANTVHPRARLGAWLHGVAYHTALKARHSAARRGHMEKQLEHLPEPAAPAASSAALGPLLDRGLRALPEKYRTAIVLCELEGRTIQEAARELGCPVGTLAGRLSRGRTLLARRLARLGIPTGAATLASVLAEDAGAVPPAFALASTTPAAQALAAAVMRGFVVSRLTTWLLATLALVFVIGAGGWLYGAVTPPGAAAPEPPDEAAARPQLVAVPIPPRDAARDDTAWGEPVEGIRYGVAFKEARSTYTLGEKVVFVLKARNDRATPARFDQVEITGAQSTAQGVYGAAIPTIRGWNGTPVTAVPHVGKGDAPEASVRTVNLLPGATEVLGEVAYRVGYDHYPPFLDVRSGTYRVHFGSVCWLKGHKRPTGTLDLIVTDPTAWGMPVDGVQYGIALKEPRGVYRAGDRLTLVLRAHNPGAKPARFEQVDITTAQSTARGTGGAAVPKVVDGAGRHVPAWPALAAGAAPAATVRTLTLPPRQTVTLGEASFTLGADRRAPGIEARPGVLLLTFDTVCWLKGHKRPTGTLQIIVRGNGANDDDASIAWGAVQDGLQFGVALAAGKTTFSLDERIEFRLHVRNIDKRPSFFEQYRIAPENEAINRGADPALVPVFEGIDGRTVRGSWSLPAGACAYPPWRTVTLAAGESALLGAIDWQAGHKVRDLAIDPGHYRVSFLSVMSFTRRPTGSIPVRLTLPMDGAPAAAGWGQAVGGLRFGVSFKDRSDSQRVGQHVTFVLKAVNVTDRPITFEQVSITATESAARGTIGVALPRVLDAKDQAIAVQAFRRPGLPAAAAVRTVRVEAGETAVLGEVRYALGAMANLPRIAAGPGRYRVGFDNVSWLPGPRRPTGSISLTVLPPD